MEGRTALLRWRGALAPGHERASDGTLLVGGIGASGLVESYGSPLLTIDLAVLDAAIAEFVEACSPHAIEIAYAGKALLLVALARHLALTPLNLDVCSLGEIATAERAGFPAGRLTLHGCGKPDDELDAVAAGRVGTVVADSLEELERLAKRATAAHPIRTIVRINTGIEARTHDFVRTAGENSKFGVPGHDVNAVIDTLRATPALRCIGLHSHVGSQIYDVETFVENVRELVAHTTRFHASGLPCEKLIVGGGFGVQDAPNGQPALPIRTMIDAIVEAADEAARSASIPLPRLGIEPGRALIAHAGTSLYRVLARKRQQTGDFVVVDGSMADNPRHALYEAYHHVVAATPRAGAPVNVTVCGRSCENDVLGIARVPDDLRSGDILAMCTTGAYTYSMASNYNRFAKPAIIALRNGSHWPIATRQTLDEVLRNDCD